MVLDASIITEIMKILDSVGEDCNRLLEMSLIEMAIKYNHGRVINYMDLLNRFDGPLIAKLSLQNFMFTAANFVHEKFALDPVLPTDWADKLEYIEEFAYCFNKEEIWQFLAHKKKAAGLDIEKNCRESYGDEKNWRKQPDGKEVVTKQPARWNSLPNSANHNSTFIPNKNYSF